MVSFYAPTETLAAYFKIKVLATILFYVTSIRFSEVMYIYKAKENFAFADLAKLQYSFSFIIIAAGIILTTTSYLIVPAVFPYIAAYFILLSTEIIESYISMLRLFNRFRKMAVVRLILFAHPILFYLTFVFSSMDFSNPAQILLFESGILFILIAAYLLKERDHIKSIPPSIKILVKGVTSLKNTWLTSLAKICYDSLPNYLLSFYASDAIFVFYNIARKIYGIIIVGQWSVIQVYNTISIEMKNRFKAYLKKYYIRVFGLNILALLCVVFLGKFFIGLLTQQEYGNNDTLAYLLIMMISSLILFSIYPMRQWYILNNLISKNNTALIIGMFVSLSCAFLFIPYGKAYVVGALQPIGQAIPIVITYFLISKKNKRDINLMLSK